MAPRTFQARLTLAFVGVVALTLALVSVIVVNRLDDYFTQQQIAELQGRSKLVETFIDTQLARPEINHGIPVVVSGNVANPFVVAYLNQSGIQRLLADQLAQADVEITLGMPSADGISPPVPARNGVIRAELRVAPVRGQARESLKVGPYTYEAFQPELNYSIVVTLSNPYTFRQLSIANVTSLLIAVGFVALGLAMIVAAATARRFTTPLRRLTEASRALAEGDLSRRIDRTDIRAGASEVTALAVQFNAMADRLEESVSIIRRDRDRSRDFLADVSHELRTPIAALLTFNELLTERTGDDPAARTEFLDSSRVQLERLDWLAQNLLELSKLESGLVLLDLRPEDLRTAVESAVEQAQPAAARRKLALTMSLPDAPLRIRHDPPRIGQVLTNLIGNAIKFTPPGGSVSIALSPHRDGARIDVTDTGVGIDASELPRIFDRFYRGSRANEARGSGSGLGLAIVRSIVDMHHGSIAVDSQLGTGSRFTVLLPRDPRAADAEQVTPDASPEPEPEEAPPALRKVADSSPSGASGLNSEASP
ncbi:MAG: two-component system, OmpR family, sensor kinase [Pseudonocardiales bacterium]|nr:two-component system, OmpR family, sensor kinase [Pseudonocardiales bacterium]